MKTITKLMALCLLCGSLGFAQAAAPQDDKKADDKGAAPAAAGDKDTTKAKKHKKAKKDKDKDKDAQKDDKGAAPEKK